MARPSEGSTPGVCLNKVFPYLLCSFEVTLPRFVLYSLLMVRVKSASSVSMLPAGQTESGWREARPPRVTSI